MTISSRLVHLLVEGFTDELVLRKIITRYTTMDVGAVYGKQGNRYIFNKAAQFSKAAKNECQYVCLVDLDNNECPVTLRTQILPNGTNNAFVFRVAERAIEAWLLADTSNMSKFVRAPLNKLPSDPDRCRDPKKEIIDLARQYASPSQKRRMVPRNGTSNPVGPDYVAAIGEFINEKWDPDIAQDNSDSLRRAVIAIKQLSAEN